jgi:hypothetical protein
MSGLPERCLLDTNAVVGLLRGQQELLALTAQARWVGIPVTADRQLLSLQGRVEALKTFSFAA